MGDDGAGGVVLLREKDAAEGGKGYGVCAG